MTPTTQKFESLLRWACNQTQARGIVDSIPVAEGHGLDSLWHRSVESIRLRAAAEPDFAACFAPGGPGGGWIAQLLETLRSAGWAASAAWREGFTVTAEQVRAALATRMAGA